MTIEHLKQSKPEAEKKEEDAKVRATVEATLSDIETRGDAAQTARGGGRRRQRPGQRPAIEPTSAVAMYDFVYLWRLRGAAPGTAVFTAARRPPRGSLRR